MTEFSKSKPLIFIVDDEPMLVETFSALLADHYNTRGFVNPEEFLKYIETPNSIHPDLLITDYMMPGVTGLEMISRAIEVGMEFPSILLSGNLDKESVIEAVNIGIFKVYEKPIKTEVLLKGIAELLAEHEIAVARKEIRQITAKLREAYSNFRLFVEPYVPEDVKKSLESVVSVTNKGNQETSNFDDLMDELEGKLELLLAQEGKLQGTQK